MKYRFLYILSILFLNIESLAGINGNLSLELLGKKSFETEPQNIVTAVLRAQRLPCEQILVEAFETLLERQEEHLLTVASDGVIDELDDLIVVAPAVRVEDEVVRPLLQDHRVEGRLEIRERSGAPRLVEVLRRPIARRDTRKLPAQSSDHERVGVVLDRVDERFERDVLADLLAAVFIDDQVPW